MMTSDDPNIAHLIDHALLHPTLTDQQIADGCRLADRLNLASVCVKTYAVPLAARILQNSKTRVGTVIGFPHGSNPTSVKIAETIWAVENGADEVDMVINVGKAIEGDWEFIGQDIRGVVDAAHSRKAIAKIIFETDLLPNDEIKRQLCRVSEAEGADFVKTSTGFGFVRQASGDYNYVGATESDIRLMRATCTERVGIKASGGIRSFADAAKFRRLGATRLGTSASEAIVRGQQQNDQGY